MDMGALMWEEASRDQQAESAELARTAALTDAEALVWPLVARAADESDLGHRLALAEGHLQAIASRRGYQAQQLREDLVRRWTLLAEARASVRPGPSAQEVEAQQRAYLSTVARLTARAAADNPGLPVAECQKLAEEALAKQADAYPLAYESWGYGADGPFTNRVKNFSPDEKMPSPKKDTATPSGPGTEGTGPEGPATSTPPTPGGPGGPEASPVQAPNGTTPHQMSIDEIDNRPRQMSLFD